MGNTVTKYAKDVHRLEKGLPPNTGNLFYIRRDKIIQVILEILLKEFSILF